MYGLAILQQDNAKISPFRGNECPPLHTPIGLHLLGDRLSNREFDPFVENASPIWPRSAVIEVVRCLHRANRRPTIGEICHRDVRNGESKNVQRFHSNALEDAIEGSVQRLVKMIVTPGIEFVVYFDRTRTGADLEIRVPSPSSPY